MRKGIAFFFLPDTIFCALKRQTIDHFTAEFATNTRHVGNSDEWQHRSVPNELYWRLTRTSEKKETNLNRKKQQKKRETRIWEMRCKDFRYFTDVGVA